MSGSDRDRSGEPQGAGSEQPPATPATAGAARTAAPPADALWDAPAADEDALDWPAGTERPLRREVTDVVPRPVWKPVRIRRHPTPPLGTPPVTGPPRSALPAPARLVTTPPGGQRAPVPPGRPGLDGRPGLEPRPARADETPSLSPLRPGAPPRPAEATALPAVAPRPSIVSTRAARADETPITGSHIRNTPVGGTAQVPSIPPAPPAEKQALIDWLRSGPPQPRQPPPLESIHAWPGEVPRLSSDTGLYALWIAIALSLIAAAAFGIWAVFLRQPF